MNEYVELSKSSHSHLPQLFYAMIFYSLDIGFQYSTFDNAR